MKLTLTFLLFAAPLARAHDDPDPAGLWIFEDRFLSGGTLKAQAGVDLVLGEKPASNPQKLDGMGFLGRGSTHDARSSGRLPAKLLTASAWLTVDSPKEYGGIASALQDNGSFEKGWCLGYDNEVFTFALSSKGADDGDGRMTYLRGKTRHTPGKFYHIVGTYDGELMRIFVNGELEAESREQSGDILYAATVPLTIGGYRDDNERHPHHGRIASVAIYDVVAKPEWVKGEFAHHAGRAAKPVPVIEPDTLEFIVEPYLQFATSDGITVMCETSRRASAVVHYGDTAQFGSKTAPGGNSTIHELRLTGLETGRPYFYRIECTDLSGQRLDGKVLSFQTAPGPGTPFAFVAISDTQTNDVVARKIAGHAWGQRPSFVLHPGDLVETGATKDHWTRQFFPSMQPLISRVPFYSVLGNHEGNAKHYYEYVSLPDPEYYYSFNYGNAEFFMIDTNKKVGPDSEQYKWLDAALAKSKATWKIACHHHPPYSSDENDYGDLWKGKSSYGDRNARQLTALYDRHGVDIVWNGHIHSYERTWPLYAGRPGEKGPIYLVTGGGGGSLETPGPTRPPFQNNVRRGHHYCFVAVNGGRLEYRAFDIENRLFDSFVLEK